MSLNIAIIGSGIAGLASAIHLVRAGHKVTLFEKFSTPKPVGAGLLLQPTGLGALDKLGLRDEVQSCGARVHRLIAHTPQGRPILDLRYCDGKREDMGIGIHRASLFNLLYKEAVDCGLYWRNASEVIDISPSKSPKLKLATGEVTSPFDLALVCDGAGSKLRKYIIPAARVKPYSWGALWTICPSPDGVRDGELEQICAGTKIMLGLLPIGDNPNDRLNRPSLGLYWSIRSDKISDWQCETLDQFKNQIRSYSQKAGLAIDSFQDHAPFQVAKYYDGVCPRWSNGSVILLGDAAHPMSPQLGQGANLALVDAHRLSESLKDHARIQHALRRFEDKRKPAIRYYTFFSRVLTPIFQSDMNWIAPIRNFILGFGCRLPVIRNWMAWTLSGRGTTGF